MKLKVVSGIMLTLLFMGMLTLELNIQPVKASGTIYIRADGSVEPDTAPISSVDNVTYTFTDNIYDEIVVERNNTIIDGAGYAVQGTDAFKSKGINLQQVSNVTVKNTTIRNFYNSIYLEYTSKVTIIGNGITENYIVIEHYYSSNNSISGNNIMNNAYGIMFVFSSNNSIRGNNITANFGEGIRLSTSSNNNIVGNNITANFGEGIRLSYSLNNSIIGNSFVNSGLVIIGDDYGNVVSDNSVNGKPLVYLEGVSDHVVEDAGQVVLVRCNRIRVENLNLSSATVGVQLMQTNNTEISGNNITNNKWFGVYLFKSFNNKFYHNNFIDNNRHAYIPTLGCANFWDDGHSSGGNYWSDHNPPDIYTGPYQNGTGSDGIGDIPYVIDVDNQDRFPLIYPYGYVPSPDVDDDGIVDITDVVITALAFGSYPGHSRWNPIADIKQDGIIDICDLVIIGVNFGKRL